MSGVVAIRGATQAEADTPEAIDAATRAMLSEMVDANGIEPGSIVAIWFTQTPDLTAVHAPASARALGWGSVSLLGAQEAGVEDQLPRVVRALVMTDARLDPSEVRHVYHGATRGLRPDLHDEESG